MGGTPVSVSALARLTGASEVTIRRDLTELEGQGLLKRVHGGAKAANRRGTPFPYGVRAAERAEEKAAIARVVAGMVEDDMSLVLDNGSTLVAVAEALRGRRVTALCLSLRAAFILGDGGTIADGSGATVITPGGGVVPGSLRYEGAAALEALDRFWADMAIICACSAHPVSGLTATTSEDAKMKAAVRAASARVTLAVTHDKLERTSAFRFGDISDIEDIVTTPDLLPEHKAALEEAGVTVHLAHV